jgi:hypothetical protein
MEKIRRCRKSSSSNNRGYDFEKSHLKEWLFCLLPQLLSEFQRALIFGLENLIFGSSGRSFSSPLFRCSAFNLHEPPLVFQELENIAALS